VSRGAGQAPGTLRRHRDPWDGTVVFDEAALLDKLRKIEALHAGAATDGERIAAAFAAERIRERLAAWRAKEPDVELMYSLPDPWERRLFVALCRRYDLEPYRHWRQRYSTVCVRAPEPFLKNTLWPQFLSLSEALTKHLRAITEHVIAVAIHENAGEAREIRDLPPPGND
jgi:hypothetical protein